MSSPTWFITGVSTGFGLLLCLRALEGKHRVVGTVRNKAKAADAVRKIEAAGGIVMEMDLTESRDSIHEKVKSVGQVDVLVNNAGYSIFGALEQHTEPEILTQMQTNVFGPIYTMQAVLESMRPRRTGTIVNLSSIAAKDPQPSNTLYASSKAALEAISESLAKEVAPFGINVLIVEPGAFRTNFLGTIVTSSTPLPDDYKDSIVGQTMGRYASYDGKQAGDPVKGVERIWEIVVGEGLAGELKGKVLRMQLGSDCLIRIKNNNSKFVSDIAMGEKIASSTDY
ncbi:putative short-chain dehydrogenase [Xylariaceae sp. FL0016]|nr:putative short-chain dehydrogenase [Xylariaceae sp. FL0016]